MTVLSGPADTLALQGGVEIPSLGLGVFRATAGQETIVAVKAALVVGHRHIDTSRIYGSEIDVGTGIHASDSAAARYS